MNNPTCKADDCARPIYGHKMCSMHYQRAKRAGSLPSSKTCTIEGCEAPQKARSWCNTHWLRWKDHGDPRAVVELHFDSPEEAFTYRTKRTPSGCLEWTGADNGGEPGEEYGKIRVHGKNTYAHRYAWERINGAVLDGMFVDHMCLNPRCCEVTHLRLASNKQNLEHRAGAQKNNKSSGVRGVSLHGPTGKWVAQVGHNGAVYYCGLHATIPEAEAAAIAKRLELHTHNLIDR